MFFIVGDVGRGEKVIDVTPAIFERSFLDFGDRLKLDIHQDPFRFDRNRPMEYAFGIIGFESASFSVYKSHGPPTGRCI